MKRFALCLPFVLGILGCAAKPCATTQQCGSGEVCAGQRCQALACDAVYYAVDPSNGQCRPLPACGNRSDVRGWASCENPCAGEGENACIGDPRCQPVYTSTSNIQCASAGGAPGFFPQDGGVGGCATPRDFVGCRPNPLVVDPCLGLSDDACNADARCRVDSVGGACDCGPAPVDGGTGGGCNCPAPTNECHVKSCSDFTSTDECNKHLDCTSNPNQGGGPPPTAGFGGTGSGTKDAPFQGCFQKGFGSCFGMDEGSCLRHGECHAVGGSCYCPAGAQCKCSGGNFLFCEPDDGLSRCASDNDCGGGERCNNDESCAPANDGRQGFRGAPTNSGAPIPLGAASEPLPPVQCAGLCVPKGCIGYGEARCTFDPTCQPTYQLQCTPYGGGGGFNAGPSCGGFTGAPNGAKPVMSGVCDACEPTFIACVDAQPGTVVDPDKSVLLRDPNILDVPQFAFQSVMQKLAGSNDAARFVEAWLKQIWTPTTVGTRTALPRSGAQQLFATMPRLPDGRLDLAGLNFQVTSLSNRIDLAGAGDCGEARITYALKGGVDDRRHRMTVIVELKQPDDHANCANVARAWVRLSSLKGDALTAAVQALYAPLLAPAMLHQLRTNEFLVGPQDFSAPKQAVWELREWHLGSDGFLALALSKQALDPTVTNDPGFAPWLKTNLDAIKAQAVVIPDAYLAVTSSEDGSRIITADPTGAAANDPIAEAALNKLACAGCHTTETNSVFTHVAERFGGSGRAKISEFLRKELPHRASALYQTSLGRMTDAARALPKPTH